MLICNRFEKTIKKDLPAKRSMDNSSTEQTVYVTQKEPEKIKLVHDKPVKETAYAQKYGFSELFYKYGDKKNLLVDKVNQLTQIFKKSITEECWTKKGEIVAQNFWDVFKDLRSNLMDALFYGTEGIELHLETELVCDNFRNENRKLNLQVRSLMDEDQTETFRIYEERIQLLYSESMRKENAYIESLCKICDIGYENYMPTDEHNIELYQTHEARRIYQRKIDTQKNQMKKLQSENLGKEKTIEEMRKPLMTANITKKLVSNLSNKLNGISNENLTKNNDIKMFKKCMKIYDEENKKQEVDILKKTCLINSLLEK